jgi:desulfoferrodoxin-like iron-binding protein
MKKRVFDRIPSNQNVRLCFENSISTGTLINISKNGMFVNTKVCFPLKTKFEIHLPIGEEILKVPVKVARLSRKDDNYDGIGAELLESPARYLEFIDNQTRIVKPTEKKIKTFACSVCDHIAFDTAPIACPFCSGSIDNFHDSSGTVNILRNSDTLSEFEKKHFPVIIISREFGPAQDCKHMDVHVKVGAIKHKMDVEDHISFIDFYFNDMQLPKKCIARINLNCNIINPEATLRFRDVNPGTLSIVSNCNAHGSWLSETKI